jgi:hypothetical protein
MGQVIPFRAGSRPPTTPAHALRAPAVVVDLARARGPAAARDPEAPRVRIRCLARSVTQAGQARSRRWVLEFEPESRPWIEPLMGWTASADTRQQVRLTFPTREAAIAFAERQGWRWRVREPAPQRFRPAYPDGATAEAPAVELAELAWAA